MHINKLILILLFVLFCGCNNNSKSKTEIRNLEKDTTSLFEIQTTEEDFQSFFTKFQQDSVFQLARIKFPLSINIYEFDDSSDTPVLHNRKVIIDKKERKYKSFDKYIKIISKISENKYNVELQIEDTGVSLNYIFELDNGKWCLMEIKDESM